MLFSDEMIQAASDDGLAGFNYAVVGHDLDSGGVDGNYSNSCCQCYQLVFSLPENTAQVNGNGASAIPILPPLVVQSFNTAAGGGQNFDVFMGAGGFGAFNACDPSSSKTSPAGKYLYTQFPTEGEPGSGGVNAATQLPACQSNNLVTTAHLSSTACQSSVATACSKFASSSTQMTNESIRSCTQSNDPNSYYHMNWKIDAKRVECPTHLTEVTGCKLASGRISLRSTWRSRRPSRPRRILHSNRATPSPRCKTAACPRALGRTMCRARTFPQSGNTIPSTPGNQNGVPVTETADAGM